MENQSKIDVPPAAIDPSRQVVGLEIKSEPAPAQTAQGVAPKETVVVEDTNEVKAVDVATIQAGSDSATDITKTPAPCPHCGIPPHIASGITQPDDVDKKRWLRHLLGEERFLKEYDLVAGQDIKIQLRTRTVAENDAIMAQLADEVAAGQLSPEPPTLNPAYVLRMHRLMLAASLNRFIPKHPEVYPLVCEANYPAADKNDTRRPISRAYDRLLGGLPIGLLNIMVEKLRVFEGICYGLSLRGYDANFWQETGGQN